MTTPDRSESIDMWASRRIDGEVPDSAVPDDIRGEVAERMRVFADLRTRLLASPSAMFVDAERREAQVAHALAASMNTPPSRSALTRAAFGIAASFALIAGIGVVVTQQSSSRDDAAVTASRSVSTDLDDAPMAFEAPTDSADSSVDTVESSASSAKDEASISMEVAPDSSLLGFDSIADITAFAETFDPEFPIYEGLNRIDPAPCASDAGDPVRVAEVLLESRRVLIHFFRAGDFQIFDAETCTLVIENSLER